MMHFFVGGTCTSAESGLETGWVADITETAPGEYQGMVRFTGFAPIRVGLLRGRRSGAELAGMVSDLDGMQLVMLRGHIGLFGLAAQLEASGWGSCTWDRKTLTTMMLPARPRGR